MLAIARFAPTAVIADRHGEVLVLTLNHPERLNAWTRDMEARYFDLRMDAYEDPGVLAMVVTGAGRSFCVGADTAIDDPARRRRSPWQPLTVRKPLVAAINGAAAVRGAELSAAFAPRRIAIGVRDARDAVAQRPSEPGSRPLALGRVMGQQRGSGHWVDRPDRRSRPAARRIDGGRSRPCGRPSALVALQPEAVGEAGRWIGARLS
jgi:hypothetical protein